MLWSALLSGCCVVSVCLFGFRFNLSLPICFCFLGLRLISSSRIQLASGSGSFSSDFCFFLLENCVIFSGHFFLCVYFMTSFSNFFLLFFFSFHFIPSSSFVFLFFNVSGLPACVRCASVVSSSTAWHCIVQLPFRCTA